MGFSYLDRHNENSANTLSAAEPSGVARDHGDMGRKRKRTSRKRSRKGRKRRKSMFRSLPLGVGRTGPKWYRLRYNDVFESGASVSPHVHSFRLCSIYDPDYTGIGHQPRFFDEIATWYDRYKVKFAKITCSFSFTNTVQSAQGYVGIHIGCRVPLAGEIINLPETGRLVYRNIPAHAALTGRVITISRKVNVAKLLGDTYADNDSLMTGNPANDVYATIIWSNADANGTQTMDYAVQIEQIARCSVAVPVGTS